MTTSLTDSHLTVTEEEQTNKQTVSLMAKDEEQTIDEEHKSSDQLANGTEETNHQTALMQTSPSIVTNGDDEKEQDEPPTPSTLVNQDDEEHRTRKSFESKSKFNSSASYRPAYYSNGPHYGSMQYYYYPPSNSGDKPTPLMFIPTPSPLGGAAQTSSQVSSSAPSSSRENQTGNSTTNSPANLPPRLRQASTTENENHSTATTGATNSTTAAATTGTTNTTSTTQSSASHPPSNGRRNRSIFPRGYPSFYAQHPPPPLMATPPGVLYPYPPVVHPAGPIAYNIRSTEDLEYFAYSQQFVPLPPAPLLWASAAQAGLPPAGPAPYPGYPIADLSAGYIYSNSTMIPPAVTLLNPEAAEWVPSFPENSSESSETPIHLDDEISFPPLNGSAVHAVPVSVNHNAKDNRTEETNESSSSTPAAAPAVELPAEDSTTKNDVEEVPSSVPEPSTSSLPVENKVENVPVSASSQEPPTNSSLTKPTVVTAPTKTTPVPYSTVISQASDNQKSTKTNTQAAARRAQPVKERPLKPTPAARGNPLPPPAPQNNNNQRRPPAKTNTNGSRNLPSPQFNAPPKQQQPPPSPPVTDEWIEVKSKKTKKFDRFTTETSSSSSEKVLVEEPVHQTISPPSSLSSTGENTTTPFSSEDDFDEKDQTEVVVMIADNNLVTNDYNQLIIDDIHQRLDEHDRLMIIMRGCPGSGKSTLANSLNSGYNGVILSTDDFFTDKQTNEYQYDYNELDEAHLNNRRRVADALKRNISPIIVDNTNTQAWEMRPYVAMAKEAAYDILIVEPQTPWRYKARELTKRNRHDLSLKRIKEMLNRFEHNITVQNIIDQLPLANKTNQSAPIPEQNNLPSADIEVADPIFQSKKVYDIIDDSLILDDVRFCIDDMIVLLTSQIYQTALSSYTSILTNTTTTTTTTSQSSTPLSVSFHDLSLISSSSTSLPSTPSTPHARFHRQMTRFPSSTGQDYPFNSEHILRLPTSLTRCMDTINANQFSPVLSSQTSLLAKKRRKQKSSNTAEPIYNTNNNNNNVEVEEFLGKTSSVPSAMFHVVLAEEFAEMVVIDETDEGQLNPAKEFVDVAQNPQKSDDKPRDLVNILHHQLHQPAENVRTTSARCHAAVQCVAEEIQSSSANHSDRVLKCRSTDFSTSTCDLVLPRFGFNERGIQVDLDGSTSEQLDQLIELYSNCASEETIREFYAECQANLQWTRARLDEYLEQRREVNRIPSLQHLAHVALDRWDEQIKSSNPTFDLNDLAELLQEMSDEEFADESQFDQTPSPTTTINSNPLVLSDTNQMQISWSMIDRFEDLYGELPDKSLFSANEEGILLPLDDDLSISIYQALQRRLIKSQATEQQQQSTKPVIKTSMRKENQSVSTPKKKSSAQPMTHQQRWLEPPSRDRQTKNVPSFKQIMREEEHAAKCENPKQKRQMDLATEHKFKELQRQFPCFDSNLLFDMFRDNDFNYDITLVCVATLIDEDAAVSLPDAVPSARSPPISASARAASVEPVVEPYETLRSDALHHMQQRKELLHKAQEANRRKMAGVAAFYIQRASEESRLINDANRVVFERLAHSRLAEFSRIHKLDLHGLHVDEALQLFKQIEKDFSEGNRRTRPKTIEIVTGYGKNSSFGGGHAKIRPAILQYVQQRNYKYSEPNRAVIHLHLN